MIDVKLDKFGPMNVFDTESQSMLKMIDITIYTMKSKVFNLQYLIGYHLDNNKERLKNKSKIS